MAGHAYEAWQTSKEQRKMQRFIFTGPRLCTIFLLRSYSMHELHNHLLVSSLVPSKQLLCFVCGHGQKRGQQNTTKNFVEFHNHSPLLAMVIT